MTTVDVPILALEIASLFDLIPESIRASTQPERLRALDDALAVIAGSDVGLLVVGDSFVDGNVAASLDAGLSLAYVAGRFPELGLVVSTDIAFVEPFNVARVLQTIDYANGGGVAWAPRIHAEEREFAAVGLRGRRVDADARFRFAEEFIGVVRGLWDTWEDGAITRDVARGRYLDPDLVHYLHHDGEFFSVRGPGLTPRSPQGRPPILLPASGGDLEAQELAERRADVIVVERPLDGQTDAPRGFAQPVLQRVSASRLAREPGLAEAPNAAGLIIDLQGDDSAFDLWRRELAGLAGRKRMRGETLLSLLGLPEYWATAPLAGARG
ncbi:alkanesulfonate monooxygenase SsuD/methylene tetrahydromethanopterin reductase-like flavin-dependent oxidoreductase (luciferase family) [Pseudoclavibacter sp. JAI123]|uniref:LLM class flavin-dependent oxidoreductase n=1 Tax=Pseudoclavibacter sp. JAI123 TaxID=2723065 RepID=UPI0015CAE234|nr:LLM class flavin-dependent oxidoreductase [Pseudoclavibacter sp. JAI123]NYF12636.1 alkanesulfonate monooxygenase SsuD/methylene tetrahydromethanopterin reductase-like flavin-dependent oxidoreductase (luciferase family) [Pseudoclavibacter sp. JAI123]